MEREIFNRRHLTLLYEELLDGIPGVTFLAGIPHTEPTYAYLPVLIDAGRFGMTRDELSTLLRQCNIVARKYFYPLISKASCYSALPSAASSNLPVAERVAKQVLCLPIYGDLESKTVRAVCGVIAEAQQLAFPRIALALSS